MPTDTLFSLEGKTALVTGGGSGIGKALAHAFSDAGARILLVGRREKQLSEALGQRNGAIRSADIATPAGIADVAKWCRKHGGADILLNAAGVNFREHADAVTAESFDATLNINLRAPFLLAQALVPAMREKGWGRIINIASLQSNRAFENGIAYGASKGGVSQLTRAMAEAWSRHGINANALAPGFFPTELTSAVFADAERTQKLAAQTAIGRNGTMDDLVGPALFFASDASRYVTGQILFVDGGFTAK